MAITNDQYFLNILKRYYVDKVESLLLRDDPFLNQIKMQIVEGKSASFSALYGHGGAVASDFTVSEANAMTVAHNAEFVVEPGQLFSSYTVSAKDIAAVRSNKGSYWVNAQANRLSAATDALRKVLAATFYGTRFGVIGATSEGYTLTAGTPVTVKADDSLLMKIDIDTVLVFKQQEADTAVLGSGTVTSIDEVNGTFTLAPAAGASGITIPQGAVIAYAGSMDPSGNPILPSGLIDWLPIKNGRQGTEWTNYIGTAFNNVNRSQAPDRLAGSFYYDSTLTDKPYSTAIKNLLKKVRRHGSKADFILLNDEDFATFSNEIESTNTYFTATSTKDKKKARVGIDSVAASFSTNGIENIYDSPFIPKGLFFILDSGVVKFYTYTDVKKKLENGIEGNEPGTEDVESMGEGAEPEKGKGQYGLLIDNLLSIVPAKSNWEGAASLVSMNVFGSFVIENPAHCGVGIFANANVDTLPGWK